MPDLPYHHDLKPLFETLLWLRVKWFGRYGGDPEWRIETSRLASDLVSFFFLEKGRCTAVVNGAQVPLQPGDLLVVRGGDVFSFSQKRTQPQLSLSACLSLSHDGSANALLLPRYERCYKLRDPANYVRVFEEVLGTLQSTSPWRDLHVSAAVIRWLAALHEMIRPGPGETGTPKTVAHIMAAQHWVQSRLAENVTVAAWADACGLNPDYFSRMFLLHTGLRPKSWLLEARLQLASRQLGSTATPIADIAERCGFNCPFHFSRTFKRRFGIPPAAYRRVIAVGELQESQ